jgi:hypothetical protein
VQQSQIANDYAEHRGVAHNTVPSPFCSDSTVVPNLPIDTTQSPPVLRNIYDVYRYTLDGSPCSGPAAGQLWIVQGELHAWPGGPNLNTTQSTAQIYTNPGGPDFSDAALQFFLATPCELAGGVCAPAGCVRRVAPTTASWDTVDERGRRPVQRSAHTFGRATRDVNSEDDAVLGALDANRVPLRA